MPASVEFVALCRAQVALLTQGLGASLSIIYLTQNLLDGAEPQLVPIIAYPETAIDWHEQGAKSSIAAIPNSQSTPRLLTGTNSLPQLDEPLLASLLNLDSDAQAQASSSANTPGAIVHQRQLVLPLMHEGVVLGLLVTHRDDRGWSEWEQAQIQQIASTLAVGCVLNHRYQWLEQDHRQQRLIQEQQHDMLDNLLHQFRNSLTALQTFGKLILKRLLPGDANHEIATSIVREATRLKELSQQLEAVITDTEDVSKRFSLPPTRSQDEPAANLNATKTSAPLLPAAILTGASIPLEASSVMNVLEPLLASAEPIAQERNLVLHIVAPDQVPPVEMNASALREVLNNLIENALKYTPSGGQVWVRVRQLPQTADASGWLEISVTDTGPGIPPQDLPHIFERRYRGVQAQGDIPGSGLGLAIAQALVKQMQGRVQVFSPAQLNGLDDSQLHQSNLGAGTTFTVQLPIAKTL